jgi:beta-lactamase class A
MREMITASSNLATNLLVEMVGAETVTRTMHRYGAEGMRVQRGVEDKKAYRRGLNNETSAHDLLVLFERIARRRAVSERASDEMIEILTDQTHDDVIPARLPDAVTTAHKTGWLADLRHDSGIVFVPGGPTYVLVLLAQDLGDPPAATDALAQVSRTIFDAVAR